MTRVTSYTQEYKREMRERFFVKFNADKRKLVEKLGQAFISKGTYSLLLNDQCAISKHTLELLRAYLEDRLPKFKDFDPKTHGYCVCCESHRPIEVMRGRWSCLQCQNEITLKSKKKNWAAHLDVNRTLKKKYLVRGPVRSAYLLHRRRSYLNRQYGKFGPIVELIRTVKEEVNNYETKKQKNSLQR